MSYLIDIFTLIEQYLTIVLGIVVIVGLIGNTLNCFVFLRKRLRSNPCSIFFVAASLANITVMIYFIIPTIYSIYNPTPENTNPVYCRLRLYIRNVLLIISRSYLTLACIACYAQSSRNVRIRGFCRRKIIFRIVFTVPFIWFIISIHIPIFTSINNGKCQMWIGAVALYHSIYICFVAAILPTSLTLIFSLLAHKNLRKMLCNVHPSQEETHSERIHLRPSDRQLSQILFVQIIVYTAFTIPYPILTMYNAIVLIIGARRSEQRVAIEDFASFLISAFLMNFYSAASFFVFLASSAFRKELRAIFISTMR